MLASTRAVLCLLGLLGLVPGLARAQEAVTVALQADNGQFVARCRGCIRGGTTPDSVTVHVDQSSAPFAQFTPGLLFDGRYGLRADTGRYLARCNNCSPDASTPNTVTLHGSDPLNELWARWNLIYLPAVKPPAPAP